MLEVSGICKSYGKHRILNGVSFSAGPGQCVGIVGTNGCGKTTLLSILAGALRADSGSIRINGTEIRGRSGAAADLTAYVPQENPLIGELSVKDNLLLWHRGSRKEMERDLTEGCSSVLGIGPMLKKRVDTLSGGMKKRLSIACALSGRAPVLIMDEPGAALDLECKRDIQAYLKAYTADGGTVILTSHEMEELALCTSMYVLKDGVLTKTRNGLSAEELIRQFQ